MKTSPISVTARTTLAVLFLMAGLFLLATALSDLLAGSRAEKYRARHRPAAPTVTEPIPFDGTYDPAPFPCGTARHHFIVPAGEARIIVYVQTTLPSNDITIHLLYGPDPSPALVTSQDTATGSELLVYEPSGGIPAGEYQVQVCQFDGATADMEPFTYNGTFTTDNTAPGGGGGPIPPPLLPAPVDPGPKIGYEIFQPPGELVTMTTTSQGPSGATVEYLGRSAGEPSIGVNFLSTQDPVNGITAFQSDFQTVFAKFDDSCPATGSNASWYRSQAPTSQVADQDPIGFVDRITGRTFCGQLTLLSPTCKISFTDTDGKDALGMPGPQGWVGTSGPLGSGIDHQTIGGGPYHAPLPPTKPVGYPHAFYYASQDLVAAFVLRSDDGGAVYGPVYPMWTTQCGGLHGHIKVTPNTPATVLSGRVGTVFVPNNSCSGTGAVAVSETNGVTWAIRQIPHTITSPNFQDPAVAIDDNGRVYFAMSSFIEGNPTPDDDKAKLIVATSDDNGLNWTQIFDVSTALGLNHVFYPAAVAGSGGRAAVAFFGAVPEGDPTRPNYTGVWHLYVAHTFDGGATWTVSDATPNDPIQRGPIWAHGAADISRNLLDFFDVTIDKQGRVQVGIPDGCPDGHCVQAASTAAGNAYTDRTTIARQSSGRRLFAANDPPNPLIATEPPGMPFLTAKRAGSNLVRLSWSLGDDGNSPITKYQVWRGESSGTETLLADNIPATQLTYNDTTATDNSKTYYYKVLAVNAVGTSCGNNEVAAPYVGDTCTGLIVQKTPPNHPEQPAQGAAPQSLAIDYIAVGEPPGSSDLLFKMKVTNMGATPPPNSRWRMVWNSYAAVPLGPPATPAQQFYIGMTTDANSAVTFEWGVVATQVVGLIVGVPTETEKASVPNNTALAAASNPSTFNADGTISMFIPKSVVGNPQTGDLLGAVNGRTFTGDTPETENLQRSTLLIDHTFVKAQRDNGHPAATYTIVGNTSCAAGVIVPVSSVSRKTHGGSGNWDVNLPLIGNPGIECRGTTGEHKVVVTFANPVTVNGSTTPPPSAVTVSGTATVSAVTVNGSVVTIDLTGVANEQTITLTLNNVSDGTNTGAVIVPMGVLSGDTTADRFVNSADIGQTKSQSGAAIGPDNFRTDVTVDGFINSGDISLVKSKSGTALP